MNHAWLTEGIKRGLLKDLADPYTPKKISSRKTPIRENYLSCGNKVQDNDSSYVFNCSIN